MYVKIIKNSCPICRSDTAGNQKAMYLCKKCNILFKFNHLVNKKVTQIITDNQKLDWSKKTLK